MGCKPTSARVPVSGGNTRAHAPTRHPTNAPTHPPTCDANFLFSSLILRYFGAAACVSTLSAYLDRKHSEQSAARHGATQHPTATISSYHQQPPAAAATTSRRHRPPAGSIGRQTPLARGLRQKVTSVRSAHGRHMVSTRPVRARGAHRAQRHSATAHSAARWSRASHRRGGGGGGGERGVVVGCQLRRRASATPWCGRWRAHCTGTAAAALAAAVRRAQRPRWSLPWCARLQAPAAKRPQTPIVIQPGATWSSEILAGRQAGAAAQAARSMDTGPSASSAKLRANSA